MKHTKLTFLLLAMQATLVFTAHGQSPVGKNLHQIIAMRGSNFNRLSDAQGMHVLQYKWTVGKDTVSDLLYLEGFTCVKEESIRLAAQKNQYLDSLNQQYISAGYNTWRGKDSSFVTIATRDGYLDITSFSADYYKKLAH
jgi:hypothetical protein